MNHLFIDVEALRLNQPWKAPLLQVACAVFNEFGVVSPNSPHWSMYVDQDQLPSWAEPEEATASWWKEQSAWQDMTLYIQKFGVSPQNIMLEIIKIYQKYDCVSVWASGITYDIPMIHEYFNHYQLTPPWRYNDIRDFRTIRKQHPDVVYVYPPESMLHNALHDVEYSIAHLKKIHRETGAIFL